MAEEWRREEESAAVAEGVTDRTIEPEWDSETCEFSWRRELTREEEITSTVKSETQSGIVQIGSILLPASIGDPLCSCIGEMLSLLGLQRCPVRCKKRTAELSINVETEVTLAEPSQPRISQVRKMERKHAI